jgi:hypothetical protein
MVVNDSYDNIQDAFLEGINEVFSIMFTENCEMYVLSDDYETNIYGETKKKKYEGPIPVVAKIVLSAIDDEASSTFKDIVRTATITLPTKQLIDNGIGYETREELKKLEQMKFVYRGLEFLVTKVNPKTLVADIWQMYEFRCIQNKLDYLYRGVDDVN